MAEQSKTEKQFDIDRRELGWVKAVRYALTNSISREVEGEQFGKPGETGRLVGESGGIWTVRWSGTNGSYETTEENPVLSN